jgi:aminocarboxymuconate-semialdehyde decarboxylase
MTGQPERALAGALTIDIHAHLTPHNLIAAKAAGTDLHGIDPGTIAKGQGLDIGVERRLEDMARLGVEMQVVSTEPQMYLYEYPLEQVTLIHRECNDEVAALVAHDPKRFAGLAIVPLQDVDAAIAELERTMAAGFRGVMIGDHVNGRTFDEPDYRPFFQSAERLGAIVFLHQASPTLVTKRQKRFHLPNTVGNPTERILSFAALVFGGVMDAFPGLQVVLGHGGGYTCFGTGRLDWGWQWRDEAHTTDQPPSSYLGRFWYDCITHSEPALRFVIDQVGAERVLFGTDYPGYAAGAKGAEYQPRDWLTGLASLSEAEKRAILGTNLATLLGLPRAT